MEIDVGKKFHITRADWSYIRDKNYIDRIHTIGWSFQGTMNAITSNPKYALKDNQGNPVKDHFKKEGRYIADPLNREYQTWYRGKIQEWFSLGVDSLQRDEPDGFHQWPVDVAAGFYKNMHSSIAKTNTDAVCGPMLSLNLAWNDSILGGDGEPITRLFDFGMAEINKNKLSPHFLTIAARDAREKGQFIVYTANRDLGIDNYRKAIAGSYANGMLFIVPWDQYAGVRAKRVFVNPKDLADIYGFVRASAGLLDEYESVAAAGFDLNGSDTTNPKQLIIQAKNVSVWVRVKPNDCIAPVVVHLVNWGSKSTGNFKLKLRKDFFCEWRGH